QATPHQECGQPNVPAKKRSSLLLLSRAEPHKSITRTISATKTRPAANNTIHRNSRSVLRRALVHCGHKNTCCTSVGCPCAPGPQIGSATVVISVSSSSDRYLR